MLSEFRIVESRCATVMVVLPNLASCMALCTTCSDTESKADVASSRSMTSGFRIKALANAQRCFCPPDSFSPRRPIRSLHFTAPDKA
mmetsp:Transcript_75153/g.179445  ORF Transcript_75153/g.179445 Transcript_75153/m.179445 type:complete len:87 (-) Transcript_75153:3558-3818(-)